MSSSFLIVGEGRAKRFYLTTFAADYSPRFKPGAAGRRIAVRFSDRLSAEAGAAAAQRTDRHGITWRATIA